MTDWPGQPIQSPQQWPGQPISAPTVEGAPLRVRLAVGTARDRDRLATIKSFYPDAQPYGDDNFAYTDEQGQRRLYNPHGLDLGDLPAITREAAEGLGGAVGAIAGLPAGGPVGAAGGAALGVAGADQAVDLARRLAGMPDTASLPQRATDMGGDLALGVTGEVGGQALSRLGPPIRRMLTRPDAPQIADAATAAGLQPNVGMVGRGPVAAVDDWLSRILPGAPTQTVREANFARIEDLVKGAVPGRTMPVKEAKQVAGEALRSAATRRTEHFNTLRQAADDRFVASMDPDARFPLNSVRAIRDEFRQQVAQAPSTLGPALRGPLGLVESIISDAEAQGGRLPIETFRRIRTMVGSALDDTTVAQRLDMDQAAARRLYGALREDLYDAARSSSPRSAELLGRHDRIVNAFRGSDQGAERIAESIDKILKNGVDEKLFDAIQAGGVNRIANVMGRATSMEREALGRAALEKMSTSNTGEFSINKWIGEWDKMAPNERNLVFGRVMNTGDMENLMVVLRSMRDADRQRNFSNSAHTVAQIAGLSGLAGAAGTVAMTGNAGALAAAAAPIAGGYGLSWLMSRPGVARWMARSMRAGGPRIPPEGLLQQIRAAAVREFGEDAL